jgi:adenylosuccinate lyase
VADKPQIADVLADRYASPEMASLWSPEGKIRLERQLWIAVMRAQRALGLDIPQEAIAAYERVADQVDLDAIRRREQALRHDVKARLEEFCALAGHEHAHKGLTSRDLTENVEQLQLRRSLELLRRKYAACLYRLAGRAGELRDLVLTARTHNVPAQVTTLGKRLAMFGEEMLIAFRRLDALLADYPLRGVKGAVGTHIDQLTLLGSVDKVEQLETAVMRLLGFSRTLGAVGQVYPRSLDMEVVSVVYQLAAGPSSFAKTLRLMAGLDLVSEGFGETQVGSSAMPHKMNARSCERICGLHVVLGGHLHMVMGLAGDQWNEGDVSCSVVRRVALPGSMFAIDGMLDTFLTVLAEMQIFPAMIAAESERQLPFLATTTILMQAAKRGAGREQAHEAIREHATAVIRELRTSGKLKRDLADRLAEDPRIGLTAEELRAILAPGVDLTGTAARQVDAFVAQVGAIVDAIPEAAHYAPAPLL